MVFDSPNNSGWTDLLEKGMTSECGKDLFYGTFVRRKGDCSQVVFKMNGEIINDVSSFKYFGRVRKQNSDKSVHNVVKCFQFF